MSNEDSVRTFDKFAAEYDRKYREFRPYTDTYDKLGSFLPDTGPLSVLEVGCGPAHASSYLIGEGFNLNVFGFDLAPNMVDLAKQNVPEGTFTILDCRDFDDFGRKFDLVICGFCVPYLNPSECVKLIQDMRNALIPGGLCYLSAIEGLQYRIDLKKSPGDTLQTHYHSVEFLINTLEIAGLEVLEVNRRTASTDNSTDDNEAFFYTKLMR